MTGGMSLCRRGAGEDGEVGVKSMQWRRPESSNLGY